MEISVRLSMGLAQNAGGARLRLALPQGATVADLLDRVRAERPAIAEQLGAAVAVVSGRHVTAEESLSSGQEVALLLPISGGSGAGCC